MKRSQLFVKTKKDPPAGEVAKNAQLLIRAGFVHKVMAGVYVYTPLGIRVVEKIKQIVRDEMNLIAGKELIMTALQRPETWQTTGRWSDEAVDVWFKTQLKDGQELGLAWSHEEAIIEMINQHINSYKDLPQHVYQFQTKFRNELRSKSGIMRGREFVMKDMYSCSIDAVEHELFYQSCIVAYKRVFERLGLGDDTYVTFADGGAFTKFSHEFQTICDAGEDVIYVNREKGIAVNEEVLTDENLKQLGVARAELTEFKSAEVGNIFNFGTKKSEEMDFSFTDSSGQKQFVHLGSYGIGITRVMGVIAEKFADNKGLIWPKSVAPFHIYLAAIGIGDVSDQATKLYSDLQIAGVEVLYDDREESPGNKFADAELMGIPFRLILSERSLAAKSAEILERTSGEMEMVLLKDVVRVMTSRLKL